MHVMAWSILVMIGSSLSARHKEYPLLASMQVKKHKVVYRFDRSIHDCYLKNKQFWVEYDDDIDLRTLPYEIVTAPAIMNIASIVWLSGEIFTIPSMDACLYKSLEQLKRHCRLLYPEEGWCGEIVPEKLVHVRSQYTPIHDTAKKTGLLFSCGLDATASFFAHMDEPLHLITAHGHPDIPLKETEKFSCMEERVSCFAGTYGKSCSTLRSNYHAMLRPSRLKHVVPCITDWRAYTMEAMSWLGLTLPILIHHRCSLLYMGGTGNWNYNECNMANPITDACVNCAGFTIVNDLFDKTRYQKVMLIVDTLKKRNLPRPMIKACHVLPDKPCNSCWKCCPLMLALLAQGEDIEDYGFACDKDEVVQRSLLRCRSTLENWEAYNLRDTQKRLAYDVRHRPSLKGILEPFLSFDMSQLTIKNSFEKPLDWEDLRKLNPHVIPQCTDPYYPRR